MSSTRAEIQKERDSKENGKRAGNLGIPVDDEHVV